MSVLDKRTTQITAKKEITHPSKILDVQRLVKTILPGQTVNFRLIHCQPLSLEISHVCIQITPGRQLDDGKRNDG
jgi:hypothetical protein